jgi:hypothetical protein
MRSAASAAHATKLSCGAQISSNSGLAEIGRERLVELSLPLRASESAQAIVKAVQCLQEPAHTL